MSLTDAEGFTTTFVCDALNRLTRIDYPDPDADVTFTYDAAGSRTEMQDGVGTTAWTYDDLYRTTAVTDPFGDTAGYSYDAVGNRAQLTYPDGRSVSACLRPANRIVQVTELQSLVTAYSYDSANRLTQTSLPNGVISNYTYDDAGRLLDLTHATTAETLSSFTYTYDSVGNRTRVVEFMTWPGQPQAVASVMPVRVAQAPEREPASLSLSFDPLAAGLAPFGLVMLLPLARRRKPGHPTLLVVLVYPGRNGPLALSLWAVPDADPDANKDTHALADSDTNGHQHGHFNGQCNGDRERRRPRPPPHQRPNQWSRPRRPSTTRTTLCTA